MSSRKESRLAREGEPKFLFNIPVTGDSWFMPTPDQLREAAHRIRAEIPPANSYMVKGDIILYGTIDGIVEGIRALADELEESQTTRSDTQKKETNG